MKGIVLGKGVDTSRPQNRRLSSGLRLIVSISSAINYILVPCFSGTSLYRRQSIRPHASEKPF